MLVYGVAYLLRKRVTDGLTRRYYFPALTLKIFGAIALGALYQFYYSGGDTFNFHTHGSRVIWEAFIDSPILGWKLLTSQGDYVQGVYNYASQIPFYKDPSSFFVIQVAAVFDLFTFSTYSATAILFAVVSFCGGWALFIAFYRQHPDLHRWLAVATLFIPSVIFWGSGILKDTLTLAAVGFLTYSIHTLVINKKFSLVNVVLFVLSVWILFSVKKYILLCFFPAIMLWVYANRLARVKSVVLKVLLIPFISTLLILSGYYAVLLIGKDDARYSLDRIAVTAQITAYDIGFYTGKDAGSGYSLGKLDGTFENMISKAPQAINASLFRPYLWEIRNPLMLISALESFVLFGLTIFVMLKRRLSFIRAFGDPTIIFCLVFSLTFAFAVGVSTFNFGTLARYKIPMLPFYVVAMGCILNYSNKDKKFEALDATE